MLTILARCDANPAQSAQLQPCLANANRIGRNAQGSNDLVPRHGDASMLTLKMRVQATVLFEPSICGFAGVSRSGGHEQHRATQFFRVLNGLNLERGFYFAKRVRNHGIFHVYDNAQGVNHERFGRNPVFIRRERSIRDAAPRPGPCRPLGWRGRCRKSHRPALKWRTRAPAPRVR